jgi:TonB family protein
VEVVKQLLTGGADLNQRSERGQTALMLAAIFGHEELVSLLLAAGADVKAMDGLGLTASDWSERRGFSKLALQIRMEPAGPNLHKESPAPAPVPTARSLKSENARADVTPVQAKKTPRPGLLNVLKTLAAQANQAARDAEHLALSNPAQNEVSNQSVLSEQASKPDLSVDPKIDVQKAPEQIINEPATPAVRLATTLPLKSSPVSVSPEDIELPSFAQVSTNASARSMLWAMIVITLLGAGYVTYRLTNRAPAKLAAPAIAAKPTEETRVAPAATATGETPAVSHPDENLPVTGDALAGTEIDLPQAEYPRSLLSQGIAATITVTVRVNRLGKVISWLTSSGDSKLRAAALKAAKKARFDPAKLPGKGEVVGTITYNFKV